jgi:hypothetical protein
VRDRWQTLALPAPVERHDVALSDREESLLRDIAAQPISPITQRYERLGWNAKIGNTVKDAIIAKGLAEFDAVSTPTARVKILSLTSAGKDCLVRAGADISRSRHGSVEHEYWKWAITKHLDKAGYTVDEEHARGGGKSVDLHAVRGDEVLWIEVETGRSDIPSNVEKCRSLSGRVVFVFTDQATCDQYRDVVPEALTTTELDHL